MWALGPLCTFGEEKNAWTRVRVWPPDTSVRILVTILTELSGLTSKCYSRELMSTGAWRCVLQCVAPEVLKDNAASVFKVKHSKNCAAPPQTSQCHRPFEPVVMWQVFIVVTLRQGRTAGKTGCSSLFDTSLYVTTAQLCKLSRLFVVVRLTNLTYPLWWIKPTDALSSNFVGITTLHVSGSLSAHHQEFLAVHRHWYNLCSLVTECYQARDGTAVYCTAACNIAWRSHSKRIGTTT
jgi:hypothetical protein